MGNLPIKWYQKTKKKQIKKIKQNKRTQTQKIIQMHFENQHKLIYTVYNVLIVVLHTKNYKKLQEITQRTHPTKYSLKKKKKKKINKSICQHHKSTRNELNATLNHRKWIENKSENKYIVCD